MIDGDVALVRFHIINNGLRCLLIDIQGPVEAYTAVWRLIQPLTLSPA